MAQHHPQMRAVRGPNGETITLSDIPVGNPKRWLPATKARVMAAIEGGLISMEDAWRKYRLSRREYDCWKAFMDELRDSDTAPRPGQFTGKPHPAPAP